MAGPQTSQVLMPCSKPCGNSEIDTKENDKGKMQRISHISHGPLVEKMPLPGFVKRELHEQGRCEPCLFMHKAMGCWYGDDCRYCHFCTPEQMQKKQSRRFYMERVLRKDRKEKKFNHAQGAPPCDVTRCAMKDSEPSFVVRIHDILT